MRRLTDFARPAALLIAGLSLFVSCAHAPRVFEETDSVLNIRADYLQANPNGRFNDRIAHGEVVPEMGYIEVLAAWGLPATRSVSQDEKCEYWTYFGRDDDSQDWIRYTFVFEKDKLREWEMTRHTPGNRRLDHFIPYEVPRVSLETRRLPDEMYPSKH